MAPKRTQKMEKRSYRFGSSYLHLVFGDITTSDAEVLVSSDDYNLSMGGGVSAALHQAAGETLLIDVAKKAPAKIGDVVVTTAGALPAEHIFHVITIGEDRNEKSSMAVVEQSTAKCLHLLSTLGLNSIAFPAIGTGTAGYSTDEVAINMAKIITDFLKKAEKQFEVSIYLYDRFGNKTAFEYITFFEQFASRIGAQPATQKEEKNKFHKGKEPSERENTAKQLSELTKERENIEAKISKLENAESANIINDLEERLEKIHNDRIELLKRMRKSFNKGVSLFISYSHKDKAYLEEFKDHLKALERIGLVTSWHDRLIRAGSEWEGEIDDKIEQSDVILLLISSSFVNSKYCFDIELERALTRHANRSALVVPILIRPVAWQELPFAKLQSLPTDGRPVSTWQDKDLAWVDITERLKIAIKEFISKKKP